MMGIVRLTLLLLFALASTAMADPRFSEAIPGHQRTLLKESPKILGRPVEELVLTGTIPVGRQLPRGLPTMPTYKMTPNRFRPVSEDSKGVFYQSVGPLQKHMVHYRGGVYMSKQYPDKLVAYRGDAADPREAVHLWETLHPGHARMFRVIYRKPKSPR